MRAIDLCCGLGGMTAGMQAAGFDVTGVDVDPKLADRYPARLILEDVRTLDPAKLGPATWVHASPPCQRFSTARASRKHDPATEADLDILHACLRIRDALQPRYWSVENVRGAIRLFSGVLGPPTFKNGPYVFWGNFPPFLAGKSNHSKGIAGKVWNYRNSDPWKRALVPDSIARPMAEAIAAGCKLEVGHAP